MSYRNFLKDFNFLSHTFHPHINIAVLLYLFHFESEHFDSSPSSICRVSVNGFSCAPAESAVFQLRNIWSGKIMDRSFGTLVRSWGFFQFTHTQSLLSPKKTTLDVRVYAKIFLSINFVQGGWNGRAGRKFRKGGTVFIYEGKQKVQKIMNTALLSQGILSRIVAARK